MTRTFRQVASRQLKFFRKRRLARAAKGPQQRCFSSRTKKEMFLESSARVTHGRNPRFDGRGCFDLGEAISRACGREDQMPRFVAQQDVDATFSHTIQTLEANSEGAALGFASNRSCTAAALQVQDVAMTRQLAAMRREG
jgi:hypothetical protein